MNAKLRSLLDPISEVLAAETGVLAAYVLGSAVRDSMRPESDLDVAILPTPGTRWDATCLAALATKLTMTTSREVDLGLLRSANLVYARQAVLRGRRFFCRDRFRSDLAVATLLGMAAELDFTRREVLHAYVAG